MGVRCFVSRELSPFLWALFLVDRDTVHATEVIEVSCVRVCLTRRGSGVSFFVSWQEGQEGTVRVVVFSSFLLIEISGRSAREKEKKHVA